MTRRTTLSPTFCASRALARSLALFTELPLTAMMTSPVRMPPRALQEEQNLLLSDIRCRKRNIFLAGIIKWSSVINWKLIFIQNTATCPKLCAVLILNAMCNLNTSASSANSKQQPSHLNTSNKVNRWSQCCRMRLGHTNIACMHK